jgi:hypothetical protein
LQGVQNSTEEKLQGVQNSTDWKLQGVQNSADLTPFWKEMRPRPCCMRGSIIAARPVKPTVARRLETSPVKEVLIEFITHNMRRGPKNTD